MSAGTEKFTFTVQLQKKISINGQTSSVLEPPTEQRVFCLATTTADKSCAIHLGKYALFTTFCFMFQF